MKMQKLYRNIPKIDKLMEMTEVLQMQEIYGYHLTFRAARDTEEEIRRYIKNNISTESTAAEIRTIEQMIETIPARMLTLLKKEERKHMKHVINATGIILHTNLGRAPLNRETAEKVAGLMTGYTNLEFDLESGKRGSRYDHFSEGLCRLTGAESAVAVNNNAAAVLIMLAALTSGREAIVSRGELVEVGGKFRIPEVMEQSGTKLVEAGTTNRTYPEDYINAVTENTAAFLKVHTSNYKITGFTCEASIEELAEEGRRLGLPVLVDLGSGSIGDFSDELSVRSILSKGADLICFSGDKLFGGPQAGIIAGRKDLVEKISRHPLMRAVRIDKFTAAALDATIRIYLEEKCPEEKIPVLKMRKRSLEELRNQAKTLRHALKPLKICSEPPEQDNRIALGIIDTKAATGGGSLPQEMFPSIALSIKTAGISPTDLAQKLRLAQTPVIARIEKECVLLDMCTVFPEEVPELTETLLNVLNDN